MRFRLLGLLEVERDGRRIEPARGKERGLLALLLLRANEPVSTDRLVEGLWGDRPPENAAKTVQIYVSRLRKILDDQRLTTTPAGYVLRVEPGELDIDEFEALARLGRQALDGADVQTARRHLTDALRLWRGPPLADFRFQSFAQTDVRRLEEARAGVAADLVDARLAAGEDVIPQLEELVAEHPLWERPRRQLMLALYRAGRQVEALEVYRRTRDVLAEEVGLDPSPELQALERSILNQDPALLGESKPRRDASAHGRVGMLGGVAAVVAVATAAVVFVLIATRGQGQTDQLRLASGSLGVVDPSTSLLVASRSGSNVPDLLASGTIAGRAEVLAVRTEARTLQALTRDGARIGSDVSLGVTPAGAAVGGGAAWVSDADSSTLLRVDPRYGTADRVALPGIGPLGAIAFGAGSIWVSDYGLFNGAIASDGILRVDPSSGRVQARVAVWRPGPLAFGARALWVGRDGAVLRVDPSSDQVTASIALTGDVSSVAIGGGSVWARTDATLWQLDPNESRIVRGIPVPHGAGQIAWADGSVWLADTDSNRLLSIDPSSGASRSVAASAGPIALAAAGPSASSRLFVGVGPAGLATGSAPLLSFGGNVTLDPAFAWDFASRHVEHATCSSLLTYADDGRLVPDAAAAMPTISGGGMIYGFHIRPNLHFSPPSGAVVDAGTFAATIERSLSPRLGANAVLAQSNFLHDVVGADAFQAGRTAHIAGITANGDDLTIRLRRPAGDLPTRLALPLFCAVPRGTPATPGGLNEPIPSAGPYYVMTDTSSRLVLRRNPGYTGPRLGRIPTIVISTDLDTTAAAAETLVGRADFAESASVRHLPELFTPTGPLGGRRPGHLGPHQLSTQTAGLQFLELNTAHGLLHDRRMREAVNYALDRTALANAVGGQATDAYLPAGVPGAPSGGVYPLRPDLSRARALAGRGGRVVVLTRELSSCPLCAATLTLLRDELARIHVHVTARQVEEPAFTALEPNSRWDIAFDNWAFDYPDPSDFFNPFLDGRKVGKPGNTDVSGLRSASVDRALDAAGELAGAARDRAYRKLARRLEQHDVPFAVYSTIPLSAIVGGRLGCVKSSPEFGIDIAALCLPRRA
jgi:DNA-binding SARP family transcriptional activator/ABC-type oligopeptide transport system substrate-binding subunit